LHVSSLLFLFDQSRSTRILSWKNDTTIRIPIDRADALPINLHEPRRKFPIFRRFAGSPRSSCRTITGSRGREVRAGLVLHDGAETVMFGSTLAAMPISALWVG
jgi:hypothetical protein